MPCASFRHGLRNSTTGSTNNSARRTGTRAIPGGNKKSRSNEAGFFSYRDSGYFISTSALPVISAGCSSPINLSTVGATSARMPSCTDFTRSETTTMGTGLSECAVLGVPPGKSVSVYAAVVLSAWARRWRNESRWLVSYRKKVSYPSLSIYYSRYRELLWRIHIS